MVNDKGSHQKEIPETITSKQMDKDIFFLEEEHSLYGASEELVENVISAIERNDSAFLVKVSKSLHAADVADLINKLTSDQRRPFIEAIKNHFDPTVLTYLEDSTKDAVLAFVGTGALAAALSNLESDDVIHVIEDLDKHQQKQLLDAIPAKERAILEEVLSYPEDSAGRLMQREIVCVPNFWTVKETIDFIHNAQGIPESFYSVFVVDPRHHPIGAVALNRILREEADTKIADIMENNLNLIPVTMDQEEVALMFRHYALVSAPVVDENGRLVGMITVDDVVDVIDEEAEQDIMYIAGVSESDFNDPVLETAFSRSRWLVVTLINTLIASHVISRFESSIHEKVALAFLMVIVAAMGGNSGMQAVTVTIRALATRELTSTNQMKAIRKELFVSIVMGLLFATILGTIGGLWLNELQVGLVLGGALFCNMLWAGLAGACLPIFVRRLGLDPAISAGPLLTTTTDVLGYAIFLGLATYFLL
jgi:magnesium transporter